MAITLADFNKIWSSTSPLSPYTFSDDDYNEGWNFIGQIPPSRQMWDFLQKNNDEKMQYLANNYLPLSGGTMTGGITSTSTDIVKANVDNRGIRVMGGTALANGSSITLFGKDFSGMEGQFSIRAKDETYTKDLIGKPNGNLTWDGQNVLTASNYNSYALPLSGGTMTGNITFNKSAPTIEGNGRTMLTGGTNNINGSSVQFYPYNYSDSAAAGVFLIRASNKSSWEDPDTTHKYVDLVGKPDGTLTWNNSNILTADNYNSYALPLSGGTFSDGVIIGSSSTIRKNSDDGALSIYGATNYNKGANILLIGQSRPNNPGEFYIYARTESDSKTLNGRPNGTLTWDGKEVERVNESNLVHNGGYIRYESGLQICWGTITVNTEYGPDAYSIRTWTYPVAFAEEPIVLCNSRHDRFSVGTNDAPIGNSSCTIYSVNTSASGTFTLSYIDCFAIGRWR